MTTNTLTKNAASSPAPKQSLTEVASVMKTDKQIANAKKKAEKVETDEEKEQTFGPRAIMRKLARAKNPFVGIFVRNELLKASAKTLAACTELGKLKVELTGTLFEPVQKVAQGINNKLNTGSLIDLAKGEDGAATSSACVSIMNHAVATRPTDADIIKRMEGGMIDGRMYVKAVHEAEEILALGNKVEKAEVATEVKK